MQDGDQEWPEVPRWLVGLLRRLSWRSFEQNSRQITEVPVFANVVKPPDLSGSPLRTSAGS
jgi:hypothetical protein